MALTSPAAAQRWLDAHRACLVAVATYAAGNGWPGHAIRLAATISRYLNGGHYHRGYRRAQSCPPCGHAPATYGRGGER